MVDLIERDFEHLDKCPMCEAPKSKVLYATAYECEVVKCERCGLVFSKKRLNKQGLAKYWGNYLSRVHLANEELVNQRQLMYKLEFDYINNFVKNNDSHKVLDVGCSRGDFLEFFKEGYECFGVEYGHEAASEASKKYKVWEGEFPLIDIEEKFDLIIFRGVLQYVPYPKDYLNKAKNLLNQNGCIYITSTPNMNSFAFNLFLENFRLPVNYVDFIGYSPKIFDEYFLKYNFEKSGEYYFYEDTPYANFEKDISQIAQAIQCKKSGIKIDFKAPSFWGNMMSLVYRKKSV